MKKSLVLVLLSGLFITGFFAASRPAHAAALELYSTSLFNDSSLISYYRLEGNSNDAKGSNNGSDTSVSYGSSYGKFGEGVHFGGSGYVTVGNNLGITGGTITMNGWVNIGTAPVSGTYYTLFAQSSATNKIEYTAYYTEVSGAYQVWFCRVRRGTFADCSDVNYTLTPGTWYDVALTYDGATVTGYVDGVAIGTVSSTGAGSVTPSDVFAIGMDDSSGIPVDLMGTASMDDVAVFSRALSAGEIRDLYNETWYAQIENAATLKLRDGTSTSANILETLPADWVIKVTSTADSQGPIINDGFRWYGVIDPTDDVAGWMAASSTTEQFITSEDASLQSAFVASSSVQLNVGTSTGETGDYVLNAVDHFYNNSSTPNSLYNSNDQSGTNGQSDLSILKQRSFPEKVILGIAAQEDGGSLNGSPLGFNDENISFDYGHGAMQVTFSPSGGWDNRGIGSGVTIPPCGLASSSYSNCYSNTSSTTGLRYYQADTNITGDPEFKQYSNTPQSIYANIKDGMQVLAGKYGTDAHPQNRVCDNYPSPITFYPPDVSATTTYSCTDEEIVDVTAAYNGTSTPYLSQIATRLTNISNFFPSVSSGDASTTDIINKLNTANDNSIFAQLHSPGDLSIEDAASHVMGVVNGVVINTFPFGSYDPQTKAAHIFFQKDNNLTYKITGTGSGVYGLDIDIASGTQEIAFHRGENVPITPGEVHTYKINADAVVNRKNGVTLKIDKDGTGAITETDEFPATVVRIAPPKVLPLPSTSFIPVALPVIPVSENTPSKASATFSIRAPTNAPSVSILSSSTLELEVASSTNSSTIKQ